MRVLSALWGWVTMTVPDTFSGWLMYAFRRPLLFLLSVVIVPLVILFVSTTMASTALWRRQSLHNLEVTARLAAEIVDETLADTFRFEQQLAAQPAFIDAVRLGNGPEASRHLQDTLAVLPRVAQAGRVSRPGCEVRFVGPEPLARIT